MNVSTPPFTLRDVRAHLGAPFVLAAMAGVALILGVSGPFGTLAALGPVARLAYWTAVVFGTYGIGTTVTMLVVARLDRDGAPLWWRLSRGTVLVGVPVLACLSGINLVALGSQGVLGPISAQSAIGAFLVSAVILLLRELSPDPPETQDAPARPPILDRLPLEKRGALVALSVQDHYVEVITTRGRDLLLMRLRDAIAETRGQPGLQVHRSYWVALDHVAAARRQGDGAILTLRDGTEIPVSRRYVMAIREAGLLPRRSDP